jgi:anhydro-N-acetylmuramic acid kinase
MIEDLYIGLMSGTSVDGIDAALVSFDRAAQAQIIDTYYRPYPLSLRANILALCQPGANEIQRLGEMDILLGKAFAEAVNSLLAKQSLAANKIKAIGSHGQTIRHHPFQAPRFTIQIGDPNTIAAETGITTVADFRRKDIAFEGQGAPLAPAFHHYAFASNKANRMVVNIGGIANITFLPKKVESICLGYDTGPGNTLLDAWINLHHKKTHDHQGTWGAQGKVHTSLLAKLLSDPYFQLPPPKSSGREYFNLLWLENYLQLFSHTLSAIDIQATLTELTAQSIVNACTTLPHGEILVCGGGAYNIFLMKRLQDLAGPHYTVSSTAKYHYPPQCIESMLFAWLARQTLQKKPGNLPSVTGAKQSTILGGIYYSG